MLYISRWTPAPEKTVLRRNEHANDRVLSLELLGHWIHNVAKTGDDALKKRVLNLIAPALQALQNTETDNTSSSPSPFVIRTILKANNNNNIIIILYKRNH
jgi:hypothetical protein